MSTDAGRNRVPRAGIAGRAIVLVVIGAFMALLTWGLLTSAADTTIDDRLSRGVRTPAPDFALPVLVPNGLPNRLRPSANDGRISLRELRGSPVVLNFWASWCTPCQIEAPRLERAWQHARERGVVFLGIDILDVTDDAKDFIDEFRLTFPHVRDSGKTVGRAWGVTGLPETFFVDASGYVVGHVIGAIESKQLADGIAASRSGRPMKTLQGGARRPAL